jgi:hypothetical protein
VRTVETMEETRKSYHSELEELRSLVVRLGASVIEAIPRATNVLLSGDLEGADYLVQSDDEIDARAHDIEDRTFEILALQAPVAGELRQLVSIIKITSDLERSADLAVNICKAARRIYGKEIDPVLRGLISKMSEQAEQLYQAAVNSFAENDSATAAAIEDMDSFLDALSPAFTSASETMRSTSASACVLLSPAGSPNSAQSPVSVSVMPRVSSPLQKGDRRSRIVIHARDRRVPDWRCTRGIGRSSTHHSAPSCCERAEERRD